jgi:uncharacterized membrane protein
LHLTREKKLKERNEVRSMAQYPGRKRTRHGQPEQVARGLAWFSIGIGVAQILAPRVMSRLAGVPVPPVLTIASGLRELACGIGILTQRDAAPWIRTRLSGDAVELAALACGALVPGADRKRIGMNAALRAGITALDIYCSRELALHGHRASPRHETLTIEVKRSPEELYRFWRSFSNLPRVMPHLVSVREIDDKRSRWIATGPAGTQVEWDSEIIDDVANERIAWRSSDGTALFNAGSVQFVPAGGGATHVVLELLYESLPGTVGTAVTELFGMDPTGAVRANLAKFRDMMEKSPSPPGLRE